MTPKNPPLSTPTPRRRGHIWLPLTQTLLTALALSLSLLLLPALAQSPTIIRVTPTGSPANTGDSWASATTLTQALTLATAGDEIWVAAGVYTPGTTVDDTFNLVPGVGLYGGFAATETLRTERNWTANLTVLSGDIDGDDTDPDGDGVLTTTNHITGSNSYHVVFADGTQGTPITETTVLDGFTITAGRAKEIFYPDNGGGGFYCAGNGSGSECSPSLNNLSFSGNSASYYGGAIFNYGFSSGNSSPSLSNISFSSNSASYGGAMANDGSFGGNSSPSLSNISFSGNSASRNGGAIANEGARGSSSPSLNNVSFSGNSATTWGGAMVNSGNYSGNSNPSLNNVFFSGNSATYGGGMVNNGSSGNSSPSLNNVSFSGNSATTWGGAIVNDGSLSGNSNPNLNNVSFSANSARFGGAIYNFGDNGSSSPSLNNISFSGNSAESGGAIYNFGWNGDSSSSLNNVILWRNTASRLGHQLFNDYASPSLSYILIQSGTNAIVGAGTFTVTYGPGILTGDPLFVDADGPDDIAGTLDDDLRLSPGSPAIDAGDNIAITSTTDLAGNPRFYDDTGVADTGRGAAPIIDLGAYERQDNSIVIPIAGLIAGSDSPTTLGQPTTFTATVSAGSNLTFTWDFGDGNLGSGQSPSHTYSAAGSYTVTVSAANSAGSQVATTTVVVNPAAPVDIAPAGLSAGSDSPTTLGQPTAFTATVSAGNNLTFTWDFGDGNTGSGQAPSHTYSAAGSYTATVTVANSAGSQVATTTVIVNQATQPDSKHSIYLPLLLKIGN